MGSHQATNKRFVFPPRWPPKSDLDERIDEPEPGLETLFESNRFPPMKEWSLGTYLFLATFPVWILVGIFRFCFLLFSAYMISVFSWLPDKKKERFVTLWFRYAIWPVLGISMHIEGIHSLEERCGLVVCNHITNFDSWIFRGIFPLYALVNPKYSEAIGIRTIFHAMCEPIYSISDKTEVRARIRRALDKKDKPLVMFPEGGITNGTVGTMAYHRFVFSLDKTVFPVSCCARAACSINIDTLLAGLLGNTVWLLMVPWYQCRFDFLPTMVRGEEESCEDFATRVQIATSNYLGITPTKYFYREKVQFVKSVESAWPQWKRFLPFPRGLEKNVRTQQLIADRTKRD